MNIQNILTALLTDRKQVDVKTLPSQGYFYPEDLRLSIRRAEFWDILEYESTIDRTNVVKSIESIKSIVKRCVELNSPYSYDHLKSVDIIFIFLEIVKFTTARDIMVSYTDRSGVERQAAFGPETFNYFDFTPFLSHYNSESREMIIKGYRFSFPSIGVENSLTSYISESNNPSEFKDIAFDFLFFVSGRHSLDPTEVQNLIQIFNYDLEEEERTKVSSVIESFSQIVSYSLKVDGIKVEMKSNINLENIWHT
jgi:hypothetical protein